MAATLAGRRLTEAHRRAQIRIGAQTILQMRAVWPLLDPADLDASFTRWLAAARPVIAAQRSSSARLAANYLTAFKTLEHGASAPTVLAETLTPDALHTSLLVTGPVKIKQAVGSGYTLDGALSLAQATSSAAAMRHALNGGRDTIIETVQADRQALGWARAASGNACAFCAMLASRGPVYDPASADFPAHDHCSCSVEPVYRDDNAWPPNSREYRDVYDQAKADDGDTLAVFRQLIES